MNVLGVDPGGTTGWALIVTRGEHSLRDIRFIAAGEIGAGLEDWKAGLDYLKELNLDYLFAESVVVHGQLNRNKTHQIAVADRITFWAYMNGIPFKWITPEHRKRSLKAIPYVPKGYGTHARDAFAVAVAGALKEADEWKKKSL